MSAKHSIDLVNEGRFAEAKQMLEEQKAQAKGDPDEIRDGKGGARFFRRGKEVFCHDDGEWRTTPQS